MTDLPEPEPRPLAGGQAPSPTSADGPPSADGLAYVPGHERGRDAQVVVGVIGSSARATVDSAGFVVSGDGRPGLDWWIGAEDRWHLPRQSSTVRQRRIGGAPVVETSMRVPGGDIVHRVYAAPLPWRDVFAADAGGGVGDEAAVRGGVPGPGGSGGPEGAGGMVDAVIVEVENRSAVPVALALAVRPYDHDGPVVVPDLEVQLGAAPGSTGAPGPAVLVGGAVLVTVDRPAADVVVASGAVGDEDAFGRLRHRAAGATGEEDAGATLAADPGQLRANAALVFPLAHTAVVRAVLPLDPADGTRTGRDARRRDDRRRPDASAAPDAETVVRGWAVHTDRGSRWVLPPGRITELLDVSQSALLLLMGEDDLADVPGVTATTTDRALVAGALALVDRPDESARLVRALFADQSLRGHLGGRADRVEATAAAIWAAGTQVVAAGDVAGAERLVGPVAKAAHWLARKGGTRRSGGSGPTVPTEVAAFVRGAGLLRLADQPDAADELDRFAARAATDGAGRRVGSGAWPSGGDGGPGLDELVATASPIGSWAEPVDVARFVVAARQSLVVEAAADTGLDLLPWFPDAWLGQGVEVHGAPTALGLLSFGVRWHGDRPALLWEVVPRSAAEPGASASTGATGASGSSGFVLRAPGLDAAWSTTERRGEALLRPPSSPPAVRPDAPASSGPSRDPGSPSSGPVGPVPGGFT